MAPDEKARKSSRIPIQFPDSSEEEQSMDRKRQARTAGREIDDAEEFSADDDLSARGEDRESESPAPGNISQDLEVGGPLVAELVATRGELKRVENEVAELRDRLARRQADFENYRKRIERERADTHQRVVADLSAQLLPVLDNLKRALDTEASVEAEESDEFRHFLSGVDLIYRQLNGLIESLGVKPITAVGEQFDPHIHEAVVTEPTEDYEPDTVMQEIVRGYRLGDKLIRPALVKVAVRK